MTHDTINVAAPVLDGDEIEIIECSEDELIYKEAEYIALHRPILNRGKKKFSSRARAVEYILELFIDAVERQEEEHEEDMSDFGPVYK